MKQILIDAIKLRKDLPKNADYHEALAWIDEAEEVEAIPISWLEKWFNSHKTEAIWLAMASPELLCQRIIDDWEKENGREKNDSEDNNAL